MRTWRWLSAAELDRVPARRTSASRRAGRRRRRTPGRAGSGSAWPRPRAGAGSAGRGRCRAGAVMERFDLDEAQVGLAQRRRPRRRTGGSGCRARRRAARSRPPTGRRSAWHAASCGFGTRSTAQAGRRDARRRRSARCRRGCRPRRARAGAGTTARCARSVVVGVPHRPPAEARRGLAAIEVQQAGLVRLRRAVDVAAHAPASARAKAAIDVADAQLAPDASGPKFQASAGAVGSASRRSPSSR